jgi:hypothetical protein
MQEVLFISTYNMAMANALKPLITKLSEGYKVISSTITPKDSEKGIIFILELSNKPSTTTNEQPTKKNVLNQEDKNLILDALCAYSVGEDDAEELINKLEKYIQYK